MTGLQLRLLLTKRPQYPLKARICRPAFIDLFDMLEVCHKTRDSKLNITNFRHRHSKEIADVNIEDRAGFIVNSNQLRYKRSLKGEITFASRKPVKFKQE